MTVGSFNDKHRIFFENEEDEKNDRRNIGQYFEDRFSSLTKSIGEKPKFVGNLGRPSQAVSHSAEGEHKKR